MKWLTCQDFSNVQTLDSEARARWALPAAGERGALNAVHMRAVQRIYGESGYQVRAGRPVPSHYTALVILLLACIGLAWA